jgi:hypothetical protein
MKDNPLYMQSGGESTASAEGPQQELVSDIADDSNRLIQKARETVIPVLLHMYMRRRRQKQGFNWVIITLKLGLRPSSPSPFP